MNKIGYDERMKVYTNALIAYGEEAQCIVAIEELSECAKEICKVLRGKGDPQHLAEEIADATIMLEQLRYLFCINEDVCEWMDSKIRRLDAKLKKETCDKVSRK
jgi:NTP pyrophosphatase (non-canonical NTP hydrolase)